jgi:hypothetical protein
MDTFMLATQRIFAQRASLKAELSTAMASLSEAPLLGGSALHADSASAVEEIMEELQANLVGGPWVGEGGRDVAGHGRVAPRGPKKGRRRTGWQSCVLAASEPQHYPGQAP